MGTFNFILSCLYFFLPAYFTNMMPPLAKRAGILVYLEKPVDFGGTFRGQPILGSHKTWRGVLGGIMIGLLVVLLQFFLYQISFFQKISFLNYREINLFLFGFLMSFGAIFGDLFFAFIKRRLKLAPGTKFLPFDQVNYVIGAALFLTPFFEIDFLIWPTLLILTFFVHIIFNRLGYELRLHKAQW